ncbi:MAG: hypothetical protein PHT84_04405 [Candidatus Pacebacteria bacterium]|nr:hypothetical protein [Candidatus Paceibacterota bacterium]
MDRKLGKAMDHVSREVCPKKDMPGRTTNAAFGKEGVAKIATTDCFVGYATFSPKYGKMKPHYHENEIMYVVDAKDAFVRYGDAPDRMHSRDALKKGDIIRAREGEWHLFEFESEDGFLDLIPFFTVPLGHTIEAE